MLDAAVILIFIVTFVMCVYVGIASKNILLVIATGFVGVIGGSIVYAIVSTSPIFAVGAVILMVGGIAYLIKFIAEKAEEAKPLVLQDGEASKSLDGVYWRKSSGVGDSAFVIIKGKKVGFVSNRGNDKTFAEAQASFIKDAGSRLPMTKVTLMCNIITGYDPETRQYSLIFEPHKTPIGYFVVNEDMSITFSHMNVRSGEPHVKIS